MSHRFETRPRSGGRIDTAEQSHEFGSQGLRDLPARLEEQAQLLRWNGKLQRRLRRLERAVQQGKRIEQTTTKGDNLPPPHLSPELKQGDSSNDNSSSTLSLRREILNQERNEADRQAAARTCSNTDSYHQLDRLILDFIAFHGSDNGLPVEPHPLTDINGVLSSKEDQQHSIGQVLLDILQVVGESLELPEQVAVLYQVFLLLRVSSLLFKNP
ncbi:hypothetical protein BP5796_04163 [Coleophoma crateriformis]|uniref:Uncharacterized protein n=1 Tax=Coleophoma crateriformis TaxID=565419 RepID=A0A3D8SJ76_9HELO|nr:hypothetical protein BP5796_04163 [Coleophoma crateriformis]